MSANSTATDQDLSDQNLLSAFEAATLTPGQFHHRDHIRVAWLMLKKGSLEQVLVRFPRALQRLAKALGADNLYHQTITWTYVFAIHERMTNMAGDHDWAAFELAHPDLLGNHQRFMSRYFTDQVLNSDLARQTFILPDRGTLHAA